MSNVRITTFHCRTEGGAFSSASSCHQCDIPVQVEDVSFSYPRHDVLYSISICVEKGTICGLLGPNGSGKTTLLKCISGLCQPHSGRVKINGVPVASMSRREMARSLSVVPQQSGVVFPFSALQHVVMGRSPYLEYWQQPRVADYADAAEVMDLLGIGHLAPRRVTELSGGERQLVLIARAFFQGAGIMLLDEPTSHLDYRNQFMVVDTVTGAAREKGLTVLMTLHDPNLAMRYCDEVVMLKKGEIVSRGPAKEVFRKDVLDYVYDMDVVIGEVAGGGSRVVLPNGW